MYSDTEEAPSRSSDLRTAATDREHLATVAFGLWMTVGLFLDGYFHQNLDSDGESFFTPWHGLFYSGFTAMVLWLAVLARRRGGLDARLSNLPIGYGGARAGVAAFALGGVGDALWHAAFGVERGIDALLSPTHLLLFVGLVLLLSTPARAASSATGAWVVVGSVLTSAALVGFFVNFVWGLGISGSTATSYDPITEVGETAVIAGVASTLITTSVLFGATRLLVALHRLPSGALVALFGVVSTLVSVAFDEDLEGVLAAFAAGSVAEVLIRRSAIAPRPGGEPRMPLSVSFAVVSAVLWGGYLGLLAVGDGIAWPREIWLGTVVLNVLAAGAVAVFPGSRSVQASSAR